MLYLHECFTLNSMLYLLHRYDADYWRLDYPPLSAWQSWICGAISHALLPESVQLMHSRGFETGEHKAIMRAFVVALDVLVWFPAVIWAANKLQQQAKHRQQRVLLPAITYIWAALWLPALILIDHGHYQFNCVCVGLALAGATAISSGKGIIHKQHSSTDLHPSVCLRVVVLSLINLHSLVCI
jgi:alpha-1,3-glucosyltransferase